MLGQSGLLTLLGMGVVFSFIIILICCMKLLNVILHALKLDKIEETKTQNSSSGIQSSSDTNAVVAAIATAIHDKTLNS